MTLETKPDGTVIQTYSKAEWQPIAVASLALQALREEQRLEVMRRFCRNCGRMGCRTHEEHE